MPSLPPWDRVSVVLVTYNSRHVVASCLDQLASARRLIIVDNASDDDTVDIIRRQRPDARVIVNPANYGYGTAANQGFAWVDTDYALSLNLDTLIADSVVSRLMAAMDADPHPGIVSPVLLNAKGRIDLAVMGPREHNHHPLGTMPEGDFCTWFVTGCAVLFRMSAWRAVGGFDERFFLYSEDLDLCLRMTRAGHGILVLGDVSAVHLGGQSSRPSWRVRWRKDWHMTWGHLYIESKWGDAAVTRAQAWRLVGRHGLKALLYVLLARPRRRLGNLARAHAAAAFLRGRPAWRGRSATA